MVATDLPWSIHLQDAAVWQRERTVLMVEVQSTDRFASLEASLPRIDGVDVQAIPTSNAASADGNLPRYRKGGSRTAPTNCGLPHSVQATRQRQAGFTYRTVALV
ncbi:MAG: hypothetical protein BWK73_10980 [Thiothrix lacustris]|uniref:Uncharacterized protein n=1 Tax=Thiothrix lacustris TaxID=525917 RepID=A0A1Y1QU32_9GAMM|nr:MAG: hypothetical protein BWK73_10980 [Thiothrix lacustris]